MAHSIPIDELKALGVPAVRRALDACVCPLCGAGPFKTVASHVQRKHGIDRHVLREAADYNRNHSLTDAAYRKELSRRGCSAENIEHLRALNTDPKMAEVVRRKRPKFRGEHMEHLREQANQPEAKARFRAAMAGVENRSEITRRTIANHPEMRETSRLNMAALHKRMSPEQKAEATRKGVRSRVQRFAEDHEARAEWLRKKTKAAVTSRLRPHLADICAALEAGASYSDLAARHECSRSTLRKLIRREASATHELVVRRSRARSLQLMQAAAAEWKREHPEEAAANQAKATAAAQDRTRR